MLERIKHWSAEAKLEWLHLYWQFVWSGLGIDKASDGGCGGNGNISGGNFQKASW